MTLNTNLNLLIVDDYKTMLRVIRNLLNQIGFQSVDEASDGSQALEMIKEKQYDLIISDWNMEQMSGLDLLKAVRQTPHYAALPFIMITAESKTENIIAAKQAGVSNYIVKPFSADTLRTKIETVMKVKDHA